VIYFVLMPVFAVVWLLVLVNRLRPRWPANLSRSVFFFAMLLLNGVFWVAGCAALLKLDLH
ncbi:MAG TPA: hypothetical protein VL137_00035, partial [Polyangiaceae bacterium]|nr:hypothetical protein [Polyangiaceae bacterium]